MKNFLIGLVIFLVLGAAFWLYIPKNASPSYRAATGTSAPLEATNPGAGASAVPAAAPSGAGKTYTLAQVSQHAGASSCWTAINGVVYDVTSYIDQHPGGAEAILSLCGTDGSGSFNAQHGGQRRPASELAGFKIGTIAK